MSKFIFKCVSVNAKLKCTRVGGTTIFKATNNIATVNNQSLMTSKDKSIVSFEEDCEKGGCLSFGKGGKPCTPVLGDWFFIAVKSALSIQPLLIDKSFNKCEIKDDGVITIVDAGQNIVTVDFTDLMIRSINEAKKLLQCRINQFHNNRANFDNCFEVWFGSGHSDDTKKKLVDRMNNNVSKINQMLNDGGSLNENFFEWDLDPEKGNTFAYVYSGKENKIHLGPGFLSESAYKPDEGYTHTATIIHETSHYSSQGNTVDKVVKEYDSSGKLIGYKKYNKNKWQSYKDEDLLSIYGDKIAKLIAGNYPHLAIDIASNYAMFLESGKSSTNPDCSMNCP